MAQPNEEPVVPAAPLASHAIDPILADLHSRDGLVRQKARKVLTRMGRPAVASLIPLLSDRDADVRWEAAKALGAIAGTDAARELVLALQDWNPDVRWLAAEGLVTIGADGLPYLLEALLRREDSVWLRRGAHHVLRELAKADLAELLAPVVAALEGSNAGFSMQRPVWRALTALGGPPHAA